MVVLKIVPKLTILPDPKMPMYKPVTGWKIWLPHWLQYREFSFVIRGSVVYCNPRVLNMLRSRMGFEN